MKTKDDDFDLDKCAEILKKLSAETEEEALRVLDVMTPIVSSAVKLCRWFDKTDVIIQCRQSRDTNSANAILAAMSVSVFELTNMKFERGAAEPTPISEKEARKLLAPNTEEDGEECTNQSQEEDIVA